MKKTPTLVFSLLLVMALSPVLAACGGDTPQATQAPPTATTQAIVDPEPEATATGAASTGDPPLSGGTIGVGETGEINGIRITLDSITRAQEGASNPSEGNEYIILTITYENTTGTDAFVGSYTDEVIVRDDTGKKYRDTGSANVKNGNLAINTGFVPAKGKYTGDLALEIAQDATGITVDYQLRQIGGETGSLTFKLDR